ncbi:hypothetical protein [Natrarchaeobius chitinivorans]|uniref:Uncharacterized protein n=1 Tax=Natrarchaeobius chitinivorans TaxID=1679083 RepID=A0A3N6M1R7_NATCH|nr:hypothetical protein [Natrarchaeobius chitinivorans]RQG89710.1 hypothetical protein EA473_21560 [Natrarchaeobius chitinivorans]
MTWIIRDTERGNEREVDSRMEAETRKNDLVALGATPGRIEIVPANRDEDESDTDDGDDGTPERGPTPDAECDIPTAVESDGGAVNGIDTEETSDTDGDIASPEELGSDLEAIDRIGESLETDPLRILPAHMVDEIEGQPAVNKRGYAMIAERYGIAVSATIDQYPWENDDGRCVAYATATTEDDRLYSGWATACADDGDMADQLIELAETRALKRALSWASGVGIVSYQELMGELE